MVSASASVRGLAQSAAGLGAYISSYFESTTTTPQYKSNRAWNDPINNDAKGMFRVYYQNVHGVPRDDATLGQDLEVLAAYDVGCLCLSETNLDWNRSYVKFDFLSRQRKTWKHASYHFLNHRNGVVFGLHDGGYSHLDSGQMELPSV